MTASQRALEHYQALADAAEIQARRNSAAASHAAQERLRQHGLVPAPVRPVITDHTVVADWFGSALVLTLALAAVVVAVLTRIGG